MPDNFVPSWAQTVVDAEVAVEITREISARVDWGLVDDNRDVTMFMVEAAADFQWAQRYTDWREADFLDTLMRFVPVYISLNPRPWLHAASDT